MLTKMNLSETEIRVLNYERFHNSNIQVQKQTHAIYLKAVLGYTNIEIGNILDIHYNSVSTYIKT
jgi:DNA-binding CsgD family transcriptional regulator